MNKNNLKKVLTGIGVFVVVWWLSLILAFAGTILVSFLLRNNPAMDMEMGWMAVIIIVPPVVGSIAAIIITFFIMRKINRKINKSIKEEEKGEEQN